MKPSIKEMRGENITVSLKNRLIDIYNRKTPPRCESYLKLLEKVNRVLQNEDEKIRPRDSSGFPGGILFLKKYIPTIIIPDIHARMDFFLSVILYRDSKGCSNLQKLASDRLQIVCVGDGFHAEGRAAERWKLAFEEYKKKYSEHKNIDEEMTESLGVMEMVMEVKCAFRQNFHFLKGNHENIANEEGEGNHPFRKYSHEGIMVVYYIKKFYGENFLNSFYMFEKNLPLFAVGKSFLVSHAEPATFFDRETLIEYRKHPDVVEALTWTENGGAEDNSTMRMINYYIDEEKEKPVYYFGGHRPVGLLYNLRSEGKYVQIHNPDKFIIAVIKNDKKINLNKDIIEIKENLGKLINI